MAKLTRDDTAYAPPEESLPGGVSDMGQAPFLRDVVPAGIHDALSLPANWTPHRPDRPDKSEGGQVFQSSASLNRPATSRPPLPSWWRGSKP